MKSYIQEIIKRKDLLFYLVKSGLKAEHRNSYLGYFWWILDPLLNVLVFYTLIVIILQRDSQGDYPYALFLVVGLVVWRCISSTANSSAKSIMRYSSIINQVYLPKSIFPLSFTLTQLFNFAFGLVVVAVFLLIYGYIPGWEVLYLPVLVVIQTAFLLAVGMVLGFVTVFIRDIDNLMTYVTRLFFYASPIIWEGGRLPPEYGWAVAINPVAHIVENYRNILMHGTTPDFVPLTIIFLLSIAVIIFMFYYYSKNEHKIIKAL